MKNSFHTLYITHKQAEVSIREHFSLSEKEIEKLLHELIKLGQIEEVFILSTCNRTEIYWYGIEDGGTTHELKKQFARLKNIPKEKVMQAPFENIHQEAKVIERFFEVSVGVHSQIVGDWQITHQVKNAYQLAEEVGTIGTYFHRLISTVLQVSKKVTSQTEFRSGAASVSFATADMVRKLHNYNKELRVLVVGVGKIGADTVRHLRKMDIKNVCITNRTYGKAGMLATENAYEAIPFEQVFEQVTKADVVISSISKANFFSTESLDVDKLDMTQCFIDLSMPRSIAPELDKHVWLSNIDNLKEQTKSVREKRAAALPEVKNILEQGIREYQQWKEEYHVIQALKPYKKALEELQQNITQQYGKSLDENSQQIMAQMLTDFTNKALRIPIVKIKNKLTPDNQQPLLTAVHSLFH